jgi:hypothetical protein
MVTIHMVEICIKDKCIEIGKDLFGKALEIRKEMEKRGDLRTRWFIRLMVAEFTSVGVSGTTSFSIVDTTGTSRAPIVKFSYSTINEFFNTYACDNRLYISLGSSDTPPTIDDNKLGNKFADAVAGIAVDEGNGIIRLYATFTFSSDVTIAEVGLEWSGNVAGTGTCGRFLVDRTVLPSPVSVPANTPIIVTYRILV